jgi:septal ring factor EnvC (AmiA/AmiB activator)
VTAPTGEPPLNALPPDAPATVDDVRASRRWTAVALAWAIAASAIAVIALIQASNDNSSDKTPTQTTQAVTPQQLQDLEKQTNDRLDAFSRRINDSAAQSDVQKLDKRLTAAEDDSSQAKDDVSKQGDTVKQLQTDLKDLQQRVDDLESQQQDAQTTP